MPSRGVTVAWRALALLAAGLVWAGPAWALGRPRFDTPPLVSHQDVIYLAPARQGWEGLPLGNGTLGAQAWHPEDGLQFQLNTPWSGVYGGALARVKLRSMRPGPATADLESYQQRLAVGEATIYTDIATRQGSIHATAVIPAREDALVIRWEDDRPGEKESFVDLEAWRPTAARQAEGGLLVMSDTLKFQNEPDYRYAVAIGVDQGSAGPAEGPDPNTISLRVTGNRFTVWVAVAQTRAPDDDVNAMALAKLAALRQQGLAAVRGANADWWSRFWSKSFVALSSDDGIADYVANLWYLHVYAMGAGSRGEVPPKFNGGLWTDDRDTREWGVAYWHWNTQETYWPLYAANHLELLEPYYRMYSGMLPNVERQTKDYFGIGGAQFEETILFNGQYASGKGPKEMGVHSRLPVPKTFAHANMILSSSAEIAMQFWWYYLYTGDVSFLRERAYPLMKSVAEFYLGYLDRDEQGRYFIYPSNAHETFWKVKNPTPDLAGLRYLFGSLLEASRALEADADLRATWQDRLDHLAPFPLDEQKGSIRPYEPRPGEEVKTTNAENPELFPVGVFPLITLGTAEHDLGVKTFAARQQVNVYGWTTDSICAARLGLADQLAVLLPDHAIKYQDHPSGLMDYYPRKPAIHPYLEGSGTFATAVGEMLLQSWDGVLRICPALPGSWSATFKLLAMGGFEVTAHAERGRVQCVQLLSRRGGPVKLVNPLGAEARVTCGGRPVEPEAGKDPIIQFSTRAGQTYTILPAEGEPCRPQFNATPNQQPKRLKVDGERWLGLPAEEGSP